MKTVIIGIAGGTGSGKSTFTNRLKDEFKDQEGHAIQCPVYDYAAHNRSKEVVEIQPKRGYFIRRNPGAGRSAVKRSSGYQGIRGGGCGRAYLKTCDP